MLYCVLMYCKTLPNVYIYTYIWLYMYIKQYVDMWNMHVYMQVQWRVATICSLVAWLIQCQSMQALPHHLYSHFLKTAVTTSLIKDRMPPDLGETNHDSAITSVIRVVRSYAESKNAPLNQVLIHRLGLWPGPTEWLGLSSAESTSGAQTVYPGFVDAS